MKKLPLTENFNEIGRCWLVVYDTFEGNFIRQTKQSNIKIKQTQTHTQAPEYERLRMMLRMKILILNIIWYIFSDPLPSGKRGYCNDRLRRHELLRAHTHA